MQDEHFFHSKTLQEAITHYKEREYLIEGILYEKSALMIYADDGLGKSVVTLQMVIEAANGDPVFGLLKVARPLRTLWIMAERHPLEVFERIQSMSNILKVNYDNFGVTKELQGLNIMNEDQLKKAIELINARVIQMGGVDIIVVDPIYALVSGSLKDDDNISYVTRFSTMLQNSFNCSVIFIHHTNRGTRNEHGERSQGDMYGGRFLSAHFTGSYHITKSKKTAGTHFERTKSSHGKLLESFDLDYDYETYVSTLVDDSFNKLDRIMVSLRRLKSLNKSFEIPTFASENDVSTQYLYKLFSRELKSSLEKDCKSIPRKTLYKYIGS